MNTDPLATVAEGLGLAALEWYFPVPWFVEGWRCPCGHWQDTDRHCDYCGLRPPWGCDCGAAARAPTGPERGVAS